uniref:Uncharacterized protein n=1 Tax=Anguilla anguilla TaxID=7936 RepID=A0A0E9Q4P8_ANGAN
MLKRFRFRLRYRMHNGSLMPQTRKINCGKATQLLKRRKNLSVTATLYQKHVKFQKPS